MASCRLLWQRSFMALLPRTQPANDGNRSESYMGQRDGDCTRFAPFSHPGCVTLAQSGFRSKSVRQHRICRRRESRPLRRAGGDHSPWGSSCSAAAAGTASVLNSVASSDDLVDSIGTSVSVSTACAGGSAVSVVSAASFGTDRVASALVILTALTATMRAPANATTQTV